MDMGKYVFGILCGLVVAWTSYEVLAHDFEVEETPKVEVETPKVEVEEPAATLEPNPYRGFVVVQHTIYMGPDVNCTSNGSVSTCLCEPPEEVE